MTGMNIDVSHCIHRHNVSGINIVDYPGMQGITIPLIVLTVMTLYASIAMMGLNFSTNPM